ncbi:17429_t:CDS:10, partial [Entrophospora sp. SA101]
MKSIKRVYEEDSDTSSLSSNLLTETEDSLISVRINNSNAIAGANNYDINPKVVICNDNNSSIIRHIRNIGNRNRNIINKNTNTNTNNNNNNDYRGSINSIRRSTRIIRNTTINNNNQQQQPETKLCESCKILHLNVQKVGSLDLCLYCRSLFDDDIEFRSRRAQYGFELYKRVKVFYSDGGWYSATMMDVKDGRIRVHFDGWSDYFDEWIPAGSQRMKEMTIEEIVEAQKKLDVMKKDEGLIEQTENFYKSLLKRNNKQLINNYANQSSFDFYFARNTRRSARNDVILTDGNILAKLKTRFKLGNKIEVRDRLREWMPATIIASKGCRILIHYDDVPAFYDEWIDITSDRLRVRQIIKEPDTYAHQNSSKAISSSLHLINKKDRHQRKSGKCDINDDNNQVSHLEFVVNGERIGSFEGNDYRSFELCAWCYGHQFPNYHEHPRCSFAVQSIIDDDAIKMSSKGEVISTFDKDTCDTTYTEENLEILNSNIPIENDMGYLYLKAWSSRKICCFCNDDDPNQLGNFIGPYPFIANIYTRHGERQKRFWSHYACAKYSPEVYVTKNNEWYNITIAWKRGRSMKCAKCKERGATIGCFDPKCAKSYHLACTEKPLSHFEMGVIFYCPTHESRYAQTEYYNEVYRCDVCSCELQADKWWTCKPCESKFFTSFDLCQQDDQITKQAMIAVANQKARVAGMKKKTKSSLPSRGKGSKIQCSYCWAEESPRWRKGYNGVLMCEECFESVLINNNNASDMQHLETNQYITSSEDYIYRPYLTRTICSDKKFDDLESHALYLDSYEPAENQLFSLTFDSSYFDIPGRAPRWATHSGTDYHGTWLPQTVRRQISNAILRYTRKNDKVLSNFLGRGTDAIECFLLCRKLVGVDINPAAVALSQCNCSFAIPPNQGITAEHRPIILQADSRSLKGAIFEDESFDHILSHPPYKNCVEYSTHIDGDLSRFANCKEFAMEMSKVIEESWRLLKFGKRITLGIGDNREHCFYVPVSFNLFRQYINQGFEIEELVAKRQRYCQAFGLGTYLCVQYDFLMFTHEFIATFRKTDKEKNDKMLLIPDYSMLENQVTYERNLREIPTLPIARKSVVMGTTWTFKPSDKYTFVQLCTSRMVERFGRDCANYEEINIKFNNKLEGNYNNDVSDDNLESMINDQDKDDNEIPEYEKIRQKRIQENHKMLLALGLKCDLGEESDDISHLGKLLNSTPRPTPTPTALIVIPHIPNTSLHPKNIPIYRTTIMKLAIEAYNTLPPSGFLVIGAQDIRTPDDDKLWPLSMLLMEDVHNVVSMDKLPLKELVVTVPEGFAKDKKKIASFDEYKEEECILGDEIDNNINGDENNNIENNDNINKGKKKTSQLPIVHSTKKQQQRKPLISTKTDKNSDSVLQVDSQLENIYLTELSLVE